MSDVSDKMKDFLKKVDDILENAESTNQSRTMTISRIEKLIQKTLAEFEEEPQE